MMPRLLFLAIFAFVPLACGVDTIPMPEQCAGENPHEDCESPALDNDDGATPATGVDRSALIAVDRILHTDGGSAERLIVGLPAAIADPSLELVLSNASRVNAGVFRRRPYSNGSFTGRIQAVVGDSLVLALEDSSGTRVASVQFALLSPSTDANKQSEDLANWFDNAEAPAATDGEPISEPSVGGLVTISLPQSSLVPNTQYIVANTTLGASVAAFSQSDGSLTAQIEGTSGDQLELFSVALTASNGGGTPTAYIVP